MRIKPRLVAIVVLITAPLLQAGPGAPIPLRQLTTKAEAIVVADIRSGAVSRTSFLLRISPVRVLKGKLRRGSVLTISTLIARTHPAWSHRPEPRRGLFFLLRMPDRTWALLPPVSGYMGDVYGTFLPLSKRDPPRFPANVRPSLLDRVIAEATAATGPVNLESEYRQNRTPALSAVFRTLRTHANGKLRAASLIAGFEDRDELVVPELPRHVGTLSSGFAALVCDALGKSLLAENVKAVRPLAQLAVTPSAAPDLRIAAASALARVHSQATLPALAALLDSADPVVKTRAVAGLAMFANNTPVGQYYLAPGDWKCRTDATMKFFITDEDRIRADPAIVGFWKNWWNSHRHELTRQEP